MAKAKVLPTLEAKHKAVLAELDNIKRGPLIELDALRRGPLLELEWLRKEKQNVRPPPPQVGSNVVVLKLKAVKGDASQSGYGRRSRMCAKLPDGWGRLFLPPLALQVALCHCVSIDRSHARQGTRAWHLVSYTSCARSRKILTFCIVRLEHSSECLTACMQGMALGEVHELRKEHAREVHDLRAKQADLEERMAELVERNGQLEQEKERLRGKAVSAGHSRQK
eukprot:scaffold10599_cov21-Tisochrysis_lutea.AAC.1